MAELDTSFWNRMWNADDSFSRIKKKTAKRPSIPKLNQDDFSMRLDAISFSQEDSLKQLWAILLPLLKREFPRLSVALSELKIDEPGAVANLSAMLQGHTLAARATGANTDSADSDLEAAMMRQRQRIEANGRR